MDMERSIDGLVDEVRRLRAEFSKVSESFVGIARHRTNEAAAKVRHAAEDGLSDARSKVEGVSKTIEEQPLVATAVAFAIGALLAMIFLPRRR
jgi:ElaB/YqjD/DUF883 family membrane-anchored ribosome-binding protein